uniref:Uncharacterized protein n=1 Tax=Oryza glumipatula TaxID=40148 RepID=A0A0E0ASZ4_9ORYZ
MAEGLSLLINGCETVEMHVHGNGSSKEDSSSERQRQMVEVKTKGLCGVDSAPGTAGFLGAAVWSREAMIPATTMTCFVICKWNHDHVHAQDDKLGRKKNDEGGGCRAASREAACRRDGSRPPSGCDDGTGSRYRCSGLFPPQ